MACKYISNIIIVSYPLEVASCFCLDLRLFVQHTSFSFLPDAKRQTVRGNSNCIFQTSQGKIKLRQEKCFLQQCVPAVPNLKHRLV